MSSENVIVVLVWHSRNSQTGESETKTICTARNHQSQVRKYYFFLRVEVKFVLVLQWLTGLYCIYKSQWEATHKTHVVLKHLSCTQEPKPAAQQMMVGGVPEEGKVRMGEFFVLMLKNRFYGINERTSGRNLDDGERVQSGIKKVKRRFF